MSSLSPAYKAGLSARNRLTDAREAVHRLREHLPDEKRHDLIALYNQLCSVQGTLEALLEDVPTTLADNGIRASRSLADYPKIDVYLPSIAEPLCLPITKVAWISDHGQALTSLRIWFADTHTVASATAPTEGEARQQLILRVMLALKLQHDVIRGKVSGLPKLPREYDPLLTSTR